ncbi:MAG: hypothetical protein J6U85_01935 [Bacteroidales bacterium]|nr:hypothetical protein [Bacteroidales bacterium]MBO7286968.1 hypothetical protein [Bacteroidales bacterium]
MIIRIVGEVDVTISEDLNDKQSEFILCSLYNKKRLSTKLHLFFNKDRLLILAVLVIEGNIREISFSDKINRYMYSYLLAKKNIKCNYMSNWEFLDDNTLCYHRTGDEECELTKILLNRKLI